MCRIVEEPTAAVLLPASVFCVPMELQISARVLIHAAAKKREITFNQSLAVLQLRGINFAMSAPASFGKAEMVKDNQRILIVDDDTEIRDVLKEFLSHDYDCVAVDSAEKALTALATEHFHLILSDIGMTAMSGIEMLPRVMELASESVVVMISGQRTIEFAIDAMRAGAFDYITKPFELREVSLVVRRALDHQRNLKRLRIRDDDVTPRRQELLDAVTRQEFVVYYQPQIDIHTRAVVGVEALVRWQHPDFGLLPPVEFITTAEDTGVISQIGELVLREACARTRRWQEGATGTFRIAVNASSRQLQERNFVESVARVLMETELSSDSLELEVTETWLMQDLDAGVETLKRLRDMGVRIAIDDFGTGYSSLSYLKRLPIDSVKLDSSFIKDAATDPDDAALVMAIITLAHTLGKTVIAEGIEREDQLALLRLLRCDEGQGYLFGKPTPMLESIFMPPTLARGSTAFAQVQAE